MSQNGTTNKSPRKASMESRAKHLVVAEKISAISGSLGKKNAVLGGFFDTRHFALLGQRAFFVWTELEKMNKRLLSIDLIETRRTRYARSRTR